MTEQVDSITVKERRFLGRTVPQLVAQGAALALLAVFVFQNQAPVVVRLLVWEIRAALVWALTGVALLGFVIGYLARRHKS